MDLFFVRKRKKGLIQSPATAVTPVIGILNEGPYRCHNNSCSSPRHSTQSWAKVCKKAIFALKVKVYYLYLTTFQTKMKFKRSRSKSLGKSEDEGFESPSSPCTISPVTPLNSLTDIVPKAPLANGEDLEEEEKHEKEATKENPSQELTVSIISHHQANLYSRTVQLYHHRGTNDMSLGQ